MEFIIKPLDTIFFRDGKPFARGEETWADSTFPPSPSVIYGALRTALATVIGKEISFSDIPDKIGKEVFSIRNIHYRIKETNYFNLPLDFVEYKTTKSSKIKKREYHEVSLLELAVMNSIVPINKSSIKYFLYPPNYDTVENIENGLLNVFELKNYLDGNINKTNALTLSDFIDSEPKIGIGRDNSTRTAEEGLLYRVDMKRLSNVELRVSIQTNYEYSDINGAVVHLGGERKLIKLDSIEDETRVNIDAPKLKNGGFKIYLSTPSLFIKKGWQPDLERYGIRADLVTACVGKPIHIGGFDLLKNRPKPMLKAVPSGSVYYYKTNEDGEKIIDRLHGKSISDYLPEQGYGIAFIGNVNLPK